MSFHGASEVELKKELTAAINDSTRLCKLVHDVPAMVVYLRERLGVINGVIRSMAEGSCALLGPSLRSLLDGFSAGLNKSVAEAFRAGSIGSQFHADNAIDSITLRLPGGAASDDRGNCTKGGVFLMLRLTAKLFSYDSFFFPVIEGKLIFLLCLSYYP